MANGLVLLTALPPTRGHRYLVDFAAEFMAAQGGALDVLLCTRPCEPIPGEWRYRALRDHFGDRVTVRHYAEDVPQYPQEHPDFWTIWRDLIRAQTRCGPGGVVFASESYGAQLAEVLDCSFIPCDLHRDAVAISATQVRQDPIGLFAEILPEMQRHFRRTVTLFGAESCGKTTVSRLLAGRVGGHWVPEWARGYLEAAGPEITEAKMARIIDGQHASQAAVARFGDRPFVIRDTDLLTTLGYHQLYRGGHPERLADLVRATRADLYVVMNDEIPFVPDPQRYGGDRRETGTAFWLDLLARFGCRHHRVRAVRIDDQVAEIEAAIRADFLAHAGLADFSRAPRVA